MHRVRIAILEMELKTRKGKLSKDLEHLGRIEDVAEFKDEAIIVGILVGEVDRRAKEDELKALVNQKHRGRRKIGDREEILENIRAPAVVV